MRKFLIVLLGLAVVLVVVDRAGLFIAEREIGTRVQSAYNLPSRPHVTIQGIPFLTQVASGNYQQIDVSISSATVGGVQLRNVDAKFTGVKASLSLLLGQNSGSVTATNATGTAMIPFSEIQQRVPRGVRIGPDGSGLSVAGSTPYGVIKGTAKLGVSGSGITVTPENLSVAGLSAGALASKFTFTIPVGTLPMHLSITGVQVTQGGVLVDASAHNVQFASG
jgi:LmeA-like phospholipid-binding